jgi:predicted dehydrogenase
MQFALLGSHPAGLAMSKALEISGRHKVVVYCGLPAGREMLTSALGKAISVVGDVEEALANPAVEAVIVASAPQSRPAQLRRALQADRHVLCVHPADISPDVAYEAAMIQGDTGCVLLPLMLDTLHPGIARLAALIRQGSIGPPGLIQAELDPAHGAVLNVLGSKPSFSFGFWDVLRFLGGEIAEVMAFGKAERFQENTPLLVEGRFEIGCLFQVTIISAEQGDRLVLRAGQNHADLLMQEGIGGPSSLIWKGNDQVNHREEWQTWDGWQEMVAVFERALAEPKRLSPAGAVEPVSAVGTSLRPSWHDAVRALELDDAARRSLEHRRASLLEYQEATEEASFKGTMTLVGCGLLWALVALLVLSRWFPWLGWIFIPLLALFLVLQLFRWALTSERAAHSGRRKAKSGQHQPSRQAKD